MRSLPHPLRKPMRRVDSPLQCLACHLIAIWHIFGVLETGEPAGDGTPLVLLLRLVGWFRLDPICSTAAEASLGPRKEERNEDDRVQLDA